HGDYVVLVPEERPVRAGDLVEEDGPRGERALAEGGRHEPPDLRPRRQVADLGAYFKEMTHAINAAPAPDFLPIGQRRDCHTQVLDDGRAENAFLNVITIPPEAFGVIHGIEWHGTHQGCPSRLISGITGMTRRRRSRMPSPTARPRWPIPCPMR